MNKFLFLATILTVISFYSYSQSNFTHSPDSAKFITSDIDNYWKAFDDFEKDSTVNNFEAKYLAIGSAGLKDFIPNRIVSTKHLYNITKKRRTDYEKVRPNTLRIKEKEKQCRSTFYALKYLYPQAKFPPIYFVVGAYNSGGTSTGNGLIIGAEMQTNIDNLPYLVAHELIHFQQQPQSDKPTLLKQSIIEGSADFVGELISGGNTNFKANNYGNQHTEQLSKEFIQKMNGTDYNDWLYGTSKKDDRPNDLGYWMGYQIVQAYYTKAADKKKAVYKILNIKDYNTFLKESGYLNKYLL